MRQIVLSICLLSFIFVGCGRRKQPNEEVVSERPETPITTDMASTVEPTIEESAPTSPPPPTAAPVENTAEPTTASEPSPVMAKDNNDNEERFTLFWNEFRGAINNDDRLKVLDLIRFPLPTDGIDDVPYTRVNRTRFRDYYPLIFSPEVRLKLAKTIRPEKYTDFDGQPAYRLTTSIYAKDGTESVIILHFDSRDGEYKLGRVSG